MILRNWVKRCLKCVKYTAYSIWVSPNSVIPATPFWILGMDFIGPFPETHLENHYILSIVDYFSSFSIAFAVLRQLLKHVVTCLERILQILPQLDIIEFYIDSDSLFTSQILKDWATEYGILITFHSTRSSKLTGKIENANWWLQKVLMKTSISSEQ